MEAAGVIITFPYLIIRGILIKTIDISIMSQPLMQHMLAKISRMAERLIKNPLSDFMNLNSISCDVSINQSGQNYGFQLAKDTGVMNLGNFAFGKFS